MKKYLIFAAALLTLAACNNEEYNPTDDPNAPMEIRLSSGIDVQTRANGVPDTQIAAEQQVGVFINDAGSSNDVVGENLKYIANGQGELALANDPVQETPYYPSTGNNVKMIAYHPFKENMQLTTYDFVVSTDQSIDENYYASDLLYSENKEYIRQKTAHNLVFKHKLSKVECTLTPGNGDPDLTGATVTIVNAQTNIELNLTNGSLNAPADNKSGDVKMNSTITPNTYIGIIPPQTFTAGSQFLKITLDNGGDFYYTIPAAGLTLGKENVYKYTITVNRTGLSIKSSIEPWGNGGGNSGNAEMQ